eukprot:g1785.t1
MFGCCAKPRSSGTSTLEMERAKAKQLQDQKKVKELEAETKKLKDKIASMAKDLAEAQKVMKSSSEKYDSIIAEKDSAIQDLNGKADDLNARIETMKRDNLEEGKSRHEQDESVSRERKKLIQDMEDMKRKIAEKDREIERFKDEMTKKVNREEMEAKEHEIDDLKKAIEKEHAAHETEERKQQQNHAEKVEKIKDAYSQELERSKLEMDRMRLEYLADKEKMEREIKEHEVAESDLEKRKEELLKKCETKEQLLEQANESNKDWRSKFDTMKSRYSVTEDERNKLLKDKEIFQKYLDVDDHGGDILRELETYIDKLIQCRGKKRGKESISYLTKLSLDKTSDLYTFVGNDLFKISKEEGSQGLTRKDLELFLKVLLIKYKTLIGNKIIRDLKDLKEKNPESADMWEGHLEVMNKNLLHDEDALRSAKQLIDRTVDTCFAEKRKDTIDADEFRQIIIQKTIGSTSSSSIVMNGMYMIEDWKEEIDESLIYSLTDALNAEKKDIETIKSALEDISSQLEVSMSDGIDAVLPGILSKTGREAISEAFRIISDENATATKDA